jgi:hypothetical protein
VSFTVPSQSVDLPANIGPGSPELVLGLWDPLTPRPIPVPVAAVTSPHEQLGGELTLMHITGNSLYIRTTPLSVGGYLTSYFVTSELFGSHSDSLKLTTHAVDTALFEIAEPILKKELYDVKYDIPSASVGLNNAPLIALNTTVRNDSTSAETKQTLAYSNSKSEVGTWNNTARNRVGGVNPGQLRNPTPRGG